MLGWGLSPELVARNGATIDSNSAILEIGSCENWALQSFIRATPYISEDRNVGEVYAEFFEQRHHIALIIVEFTSAGGQSKDAQFGVLKIVGDARFSEAFTSYSLRLTWQSLGFRLRKGLRRNGTTFRDL